MTPRGHVLVTGAGGFVGQHLVHVLIQHNFAVTAVDTAFAAAVPAAWQGRVTCLAHDARSLPPLAVEALVHGAAITGTPAEVGLSPEDHFRANMDAVPALLAWAQAQGVRRTVFISSDGIYHAHSGAVAEDQPARPQGLYAVAKAATEALVNTCRSEYGRDVLTMRLSSIYGPGEMARPSRPRTSPVQQLIQQALTEGRMVLSHPQRARAWTYAPDVGAALVALLRAQTLPHGLYNVASHECLTDLQVAQAIAAHLPGVYIDVMPDDGTHFPRQGYLSHQRLHADTGFSAWTPFYEGIRQVIAWQQAETYV
ncbi:MAG: NAD(P)-dependent oxidoreductase [Anaerolineae bacterium]|nr:NAD(P)-dependent oxidoreductase [Anaerolineae bacterium]